MIQRATMRQATFLWKNERGIYFFRARIPKRLSEYFSSSEIKKSLQTDSYRVELDYFTNEIMSKRDDTLERAKRIVDSLFVDEAELKEKATQKFVEQMRKDASIQNTDLSKTQLITHIDLHGNKIIIDHGDAEEERKTLQALLAAQSVPESRTINLRQVTLSEVINEFVKAKIADGKWNANPQNSTHDQGRTRLALLLEIIGNKQSTELTELDAINVEETLPNVPTNPNKGALAKLPNLQEKINTDHSKHPRLSKSTQSKYWELFKELIKFAKQKKYIEADISENCRGIKFSKKEAKANEWRKFTDEDLQNIFNGHVYQSEKRSRTRSHEYHFWLPLLAAYTGEELMSCHSCF